MRSELRTSSRIGISSSPSRFFGRDSSRSTCVWLSRSSAASSIVTIRSSFGIAVESALSSVVLPEPVPPEISMFSWAWMQRWRNSTVSVAERPELDHVVERQPLAAELADRDQRAAERERRDDGVDAAAVGQARVDHRRRLVDAAADLGDHLVDDPAQVRLVVEPDVGLGEPAGALDPDVVRAVDHDLGHGVVGEEPLERAVAEDVVGDLERDPLPVVARDPRLLGELVANVREHPLAERLRVHVDVVELWPEVADDGEVDAALDLRERIAARAVDGFAVLRRSCSSI